MLYKYWVYMFIIIFFWLQPQNFWYLDIGIVIDMVILSDFW